jgi:alkyl sulfatase BDS1-like metallo-beta-lactamase superfamily hydrolase
LLLETGDKLDHMMRALLAISLALPAFCQPPDTAATRLLREHNKKFERRVVRVSESVYSAVGYGVSVFSIIVGPSGVVMIDAGQDPAASAAALQEFRKHSTLPLKAIIYTHSHGDHTGGTPAFARPGDGVELWIRRGGISLLGSSEEVGLKHDRVRNQYQFGYRLPASQRLTHGVGPITETSNVYPVDKRDLGQTKRTLEIAGLTLEVAPNPGETDDHIYVWFPKEKVVFSGDNFYAVWPNLYAIRGTPYRDVRQWGESNDRMLQLGPEHLVPGHTAPISGKDAVTGALTDYRDAIRFVFTKTIEGINLGLTPDQLVEHVKLPTHLEQSPYLQPFYGHPAWAVRSIFSGYFGWFDGNPTNLFPLPPPERSENWIRLTGGRRKLINEARRALTSRQPQWAAELCDVLLAAEPKATDVKVLKARALEALAADQVNPLARNYYLSVAQDLRR